MIIATIDAWKSLEPPHTPSSHLPASRTRHYSSRAHCYHCCKRWEFSKGKSMSSRVTKRTDGVSPVFLSLFKNTYIHFLYIFKRKYIATVYSISQSVRQSTRSSDHRPLAQQTVVRICWVGWIRQKKTLARRRREGCVLSSFCSAR